MTPRDREIIRRYRVDEDTMQCIGDSMGISRERVRQVLKNNGETLSQRPRICGVEGCQATRHTSRWCQRHTVTAYVHGDPLWVRPRLARDTHGTFSGWFYGGCRCEHCYTAYRQSVFRRTAKMRSDVARAPHGTNSGYRNWGCRCELCRAAGATANALGRAKRKLRQPQLAPS